ncbi:hypothetical protein GY45DRAFT_1325688 [Cubamyces sp. BRFM 1775]|nr:hypothetical protein GY45DRAFT_1325688 [Cubamyces sp. BRFM 1775]
MGLADLSNGRRVHSLKRRKLTHSTSLTSPPISTIPLGPSLIPLQTGDVKASVCNSCHRAFAGSKRNQLVQCARCHEPTCTICSRTCNGYPPSVPPTPALTTSPSSGPDTPLMSPRRSATALTADLRVSRDHAPVQSLAGRRRKVRDLDDDEDNAVAKGTQGADAENEWPGNANGVLPGCGRTLCQKCCFETPSSDLTTCYDCAAQYGDSYDL